MISRFVCISFLTLFLGCSNNSEGDSVSPDQQQRQISEIIFSDSVTDWQVAVFYEVGATPYTGTIGLSGDQTWDITEESYTALFSSHTSRLVTVPKTLSAMTEIADQGKSEWTSQELAALGDSLSPTLANAGTVQIPVIFLNGEFEGNSSVLGVQISGSHYAFIFKDVVTSVGGGATSQRYVEQATVVHEIGHAVGLVNNGIPMVTDHEDSGHPKHTINEDGVMYWSVESSDDILTFLTDIIAADQRNLFESQSLQDGRSYHPQ